MLITSWTSQCGNPCRTLPQTLHALGMNAIPILSLECLVKSWCGIEPRLLGSQPNPASVHYAAIMSEKACRLVEKVRESIAHSTDCDDADIAQDVHMRGSDVKHMCLSFSLSLSSPLFLFSSLFEAYVYIRPLSLSLDSLSLCADMYAYIHVFLCLPCINTKVYIICT